MNHIKVDQGNKLIRSVMVNLEYLSYPYIYFLQFGLSNMQKNM